jgi:hypothetical protein
VTWRCQRCLTIAAAALLASSCGRPVDSTDLTSEIARIQAVDNHAHPVRVEAPGERDREFDALPVDNMEPSSDPMYLRPGDAGVAEAKRALFASPKQTVMREKGDGYPAWVLDQMGVAVMLANRVQMGRGIAAPRFLWVPYADALLFPLDNAKLAEKNSDRKAFFSYEDILLRRYLKDAALVSAPATLGEYLARVVTPTLERQKQGGAVAEKFEVAYLRSLDFDKVDRAVADGIYARHMSKGAPSAAEYKPLQDFLFRYIAVECGRLGMAVHIHTMAGAGSYFHVGGVNPLLLESVLNDPDLRKTTFVMVHGGWPFTREITALLEKPNAYLDYSAQSLLLPPATLARTLREWLEWVPEKVMFGTDAYPYSEEMGWEESGWIAARRGREALAIALGAMMREDGISRERALQLARMALRDNAAKLYRISIPDR